MKFRHSLASTLRQTLETARGAWPWSRVPATDASATMFAGIRHRLTFWYTGVLASILILSGLLLYFGMQQTLLGPVNNQLATSAGEISEAWQEHNEEQPSLSCPLPLAAIHDVPYVMCFDRNGDVLIATQLGSVLPAFTSPSLAEAALSSPNGQATDTVDAGNGLGAIRRDALVVRDPANNSIIGVVQVGIPIQGELAALHVLAVLLLIFGVLTLIGAALGGIFLSARALAPAHLAFARQQAFIADAAHELRTPLTLLRADAEVLLRGRERLDPDDAALLDDIVTESAHMGALAANLLTLARLDTATVHPERDVVDLADIAASVVQRADALAAEKQITATAKSAGQVLVLGDRALLEQAALILLDNAIKYNRPGGNVTVRAYLAGKQAYLEVRDTGVGIPAQHLPHLGERFYRVDKARSRETGGAGLGLSIARGIAAAHNGTLTLASVPDQGTTATLTFPAATA